MCSLDASGWQLSSVGLWFHCGPTLGQIIRLEGSMLHDLYKALSVSVAVAFRGRAKSLQRESPDLDENC